MILKAKESVGVMPDGVIDEYGISPVDGKENEKVWPKSERGSFLIVKGEQYNVGKAHPFFGDSVSSGKKVQHDSASPSDSGTRSRS